MQRRSRSVSDLSSSCSIKSYNDSPFNIEDGSSLVQSTETRGSLWQQYSLIAKHYKMNAEPSKRCCANDYMRPWLLKLIFLLVIAFGLIVSCMELRFSTYGPYKININGGDQILVPTSTYINKDVKFSVHSVDNAGNLQLYVLKDKPQILERAWKTYEIGGSFYMSSWTYQYWGLYLLKGTVVDISVCADLHLQFYILKGKKKLKQWTQETLFHNYDYHTRIQPQPDCKKKAMFKSHVLTVLKSDLYYISFSSSVGWRFLTKVSVLLSFNRTYYDLSNFKYTCILSNESCYARLEYGSKDISLIQAVSLTSSAPNAFQTIKLKVIPLPRWSFYLKLFGSIYTVVLIITILYTVWRLCVNSCFGSVEKESINTKRQSLYSMNNPARNDGIHNWLVITPLQEYPAECLYEIRERDSISLVNGGYEGERRDSAGSITSVESLFMRSRNESAMENLYRQERYINDQQLLDSCMTSAGISAI